MYVFVYLFVCYLGIEFWDVCVVGEGDDSYELNYDFVEIKK